MQQIYANTGASTPAGGFKRTNFILNENALKLWPTYAVSGTTEFKPYPVFNPEVADPMAAVCPPRMPSRFEVNGRIPDADSMSVEEIREYDGQVIPPAFTNVPIVTWVGRDGVHFIDYCSDLANYRLDADPDDFMPATPYAEMARVLGRMIPTDRNPDGDGKPCPPTLARARQAGKGVLGLKSPTQTVLVRGALKRFKGKPMETKYSENGVLWKACLMISQTSARLALRNEFSKKLRPQDPIGPDNFALQHMFHPGGTFLAFSKINPADRASDIVVKADYDEAFNKALCAYYAVNSEAEYYAKIREDLGAFQSLESMLNIMTVQQQLELIFDQFPPAWIWYGLRDGRYAAMIPDEIKRAALADPEWSARFGVAGVSYTQSAAPASAAPVAEQIPMTFPPQQPTAPVMPSMQGASQLPPGVQSLMKDASVSYQPSTAERILQQYGGK